MSTKNRWDEIYNKEDYHYGTKPNDFLKEQSHLIKPKSNILCIAEGEGRNAIYLASLSHQVSALDASIVGLNKMKKLASEKNLQVEAVQADLNDYVFENNKWDAIVAIWCHLPKSLRIKIHQNSINSLKQNGLFILESYTPKQLEYKTGGPADIDMLLTLEDFKNNTTGINIEIGQEVIRDVQEGSGHFGMSATVQIVARKI